MAEYKMTFSRELNDVLTELEATKTNKADTKGEVITRAVALYSYLHREVEKQAGNKVAILDKNDAVLIKIADLP